MSWFELQFWQKSAVKNLNLNVRADPGRRPDATAAPHPHPHHVRQRVADKRDDRTVQLKRGGGSAVPFPAEDHANEAPPPAPRSSSLSAAAVGPGGPGGAPERL